MDLNFINTSLILASGALLGRIADVIKGVNNLLDLYKKSPTNGVYQIDSSNLARDTNKRFGFSFVLPKTWDRMDPVNGDGNRVIHPKNPDVMVSFSGHYDALNFRGVSETVAENLVWRKKENGFKLLLSRQCGTYYDTLDGGNVKTGQLNAWRIKYSFRKERKILVVIQFHCYYNGICFQINCQAPKKEFDFYEDFFLYLISEFRVLSKNSLFNT
ncbi:MAG TPA: hypothetical protein VGQ59_19730 [Cyclobacteriaceae bacterium]|jgi:hypothetical protein|nr:hypothetical protein [Cyclobacteriaceae bacterium]